MVKTCVGLFYCWFLFYIDVITTRKQAPTATTTTTQKHPYISEIHFSPDYGLYNQKFLQQIYQHKIYCDINLILADSFISKFNNIHEAQKFVQIALQYVNIVYERQFSWKKNYPMIVYEIKSIQPLPLDSYLYKHMKDPELLLKTFNEMILSKKHQYCQHVLLTGEDWNDILGVAYQDSVHSPKGALCEAPSSFIITSLMKRKFVNHATLAYLFAHEAAHTLCADHDLDSKDSINPRSRHMMIDANHFNISFISKESIVKYFIMDSGTGMIPEYALPRFSASSVNVIAQCLFIKGLKCFKESNHATCGNGVVEFDEECDSNDNCCYQPGTPNECQFINDAVCSPNQPCCSSSCQFHNSTHLCHKADKCSDNSYCSGYSATCKIDYSSIKNFTECNDGRALCHFGECKQSICSKYGKRPCHPMGDDACVIKCYDNKKKQCETIINSTSSKPLFLPDGWRCGPLFQNTCHNGLCYETNLHSLNNYDIPSKYVTTLSTIMIIGAVAGIVVCVFGIYKGLFF